MHGLRRDHLLLLATLLVACGDDADPGGLTRKLRAASRDTCKGDSCFVRSRAIPALRGKILDRRGVPLADNRPPLERVYPHGALAAHVIGYMTALNDSEVDRLGAQGYQPDDRIGRYGIEREWEVYLRGKPGRALELVDRKGQIITDPALLDELTDDELGVDPMTGDNVVLTLDAELQRLAEDAVAPHGAGAVAVVEVATGKILALVSKPSFDPQVMTGSPSRADHASLMSDPRKPFIDKTLRQTYAPGSLYAFTTAIAALEDGLTQPDARLACAGSLDASGTTFGCTARHGSLDLADALQRTCHVHVWKLAERTGIDRIGEIARHFGFGEKTALGLNGDAPGRVPTKAWYEQRGSFRLGYTYNAAIGQGDVEVTVIQLAMAYAALASGTRYVPRLVERVESPAGKLLQSFAPRIASGWRAPSDGSLALLRSTMSRAVNQRGGPSSIARSSFVAIAGQSASAEVRARRRPPDDPLPEGWDPARSHARFAGWAPADAPEVAIVVLIEHGGSGTDVAAPVARKILESWWTSVR